MPIAYCRDCAFSIEVEHLDPGKTICPLCNKGTLVYTTGQARGNRDHVPGDINPSPQKTTGPAREGMKFDAGKLDWTLLPVGPTEDVLRVLEHGVEKYARDNWKSVEDGERRYLAALLRHAVAIVRGETIDKESGLTHSAHIACNALFLNHFEKRK